MDIMNASSRMLVLGLVIVAPLALAAPAVAQELTFEFQVTIGGVSSDWHAFGLREDARQGIDAWDLPEPPAVPGATFRSYLAMFEPLAGLPNRWLHDFRPVNSITLDRVELWQLVIEAPPGSACRVDLRSREPIGIPYDLYWFGDGTYYTPLQAPATLTFNIGASPAVRFFELRLDESVPAHGCTWGGVKSLFR